MAFKDLKIVRDIKGAFSSTASKEQEKTITQLVNAIKYQRSLYRKEILQWKMARAAALDPNFPRRKLLIDLYEDILGDAYIYGLTDTRKKRVSNKDFQIENAKGEVDDYKTELLQKRWFNEFVKSAIDAIYYGYSLIYPKELDQDGFIKKISIVYREHIVPEKEQILINSYDQEGVSFSDGAYKKWLIWINEENFLGLLDKAAPLWIFKKHSWQNWDEFEEMFGIPMRTAKTASQDKRVLDEIDSWLKDFGSSNYARLPQDVEFEIKESTSRDAFNVFNEKRKACNEELAMLIDGNAEAAKDSGSRAKSQTIIDSTQALIAMDDDKRVKFIVQDVLLPFLSNLGYPFEKGDKFEWNDNEQSTPEERLNIFKGVKYLGYKVKKTQIESELDVELEEIEEPEPANPSKEKDTKNLIQNFRTPHVHTSNCGCEARASYRLIDFNLLNSLSKDEEAFLKKYFENPDSIKWSYNEFKATHAPLLEALKEGFNGIDTDFESDDHKLMELFNSNIHRFGVDKTLKEILDLNQILKTSKDFSEFRKRAKVMFPNYKEKWLRSEYEQAWAVSRMGKRYNEMMANIDIAPFWRLVAVLDKGTTKICRSLHKKVFSKRDPRSWQFLPTNHWGCRSDAEDVLESYSGEVTSFDDAVTLDPDGYANMQKQGFAVNWGDTGEVFSATQSYLRNGGVEPLDVMTLNFKDYELPESSVINKTSSVPLIALVFELLADRSGKAKFINVFELPVWLDKELFEATQLKLRSSIKDVLNAPDEVYWNKIDNENINTYFKFYKDETLKIVTSNLGKENTIIKSIQSVDNPDQFRNGLLTYTPKEHISKRLSQYEGFGPEYKKISFNKENGGFIVKHNNHLASETPNNLLTSKLLESLGKSVELLPVGTDKAADALVNRVEWEFKLLTNYENLFNRLKEEIKRGLTQSSNVMIHINNNYNLKDITRALNASVKNDTKGKLKFVSILFNDNRLYIFSRKQIETKEFEKILKQ